MYKSHNTKGWKGPLKIRSSSPAKQIHLEKVTQQHVQSGCKCLWRWRKLVEMYSIQAAPCPIALLRHKPHFPLLWCGNMAKELLAYPELQTWETFPWAGSMSVHSSLQGSSLVLPLLLVSIWQWQQGICILLSKICHVNISNLSLVVFFFLSQYPTLFLKYLLGKSGIINEHTSFSFLPPICSEN